VIWGVPDFRPQSPERGNAALLSEKQVAGWKVQPEEGEAMSLSSKRKKRTKAEQKERRQRNGGSQPSTPSFKRVFTAVTEPDFADRWTPATQEAIIALCGRNVDAEEICRLAETMLMQNIDPTHRPAVEAVAVLLGHPYTAPSYRPQLIEAAILAAVDPVFIAESGPDAPWRKEDPLALLFD
jgi:hypothetical protein